MVERLVTLPPGATLAHALALMRARNIHEIPVLDGSRLLGFVTMEGVATRTNLPLSTKVDNLLTLPPRLSPETGWEEMVDTLLSSALRAAPVVDRRGVLKGLISRTDLVRILPTVSRLGDATVDDIAGPVSDVVDEREHLGRLIGRVREDPPLAVLGRHGRLVGSLGLADLSRAFWHPKTAGKRDFPRERAGKGSVLKLEARSIMRSPPVVVPTGAPALEAARRMHRTGVSSVFVERSGRPLGVVTQVDLLEAAVGGRPSVRPRENVFVRVHGFSPHAAPDVATDIDHAVSAGLERIHRRLPAVLLDLHVTPEGVHRSGNVTVAARLHTPFGIVRGTRSDWDVRQAVARVMEQIERQTRDLSLRRREERRSRRGRERGDRVVRHTPRRRKQVRRPARRPRGGSGYDASP